jgi:hypothetical protein
MIILENAIKEEDENRRKRNKGLEAEFKEISKLKRDDKEK